MFERIIAGLVMLIASVAIVAALLYMAGVRF
jgi:hypothetical protein